MKRPEHLFLSSEGTLFDTRRPDWTYHPLRSMYSFTFQDIRTVRQFKATLRAGAYAWPGGYPMFLVTDDGAALCWSCSKLNARQIMSAIADRRRDGWRVVACDVNWEDDSLVCDHCCKTIECAYGDALRRNGG